MEQGSLCGALLYELTPAAKHVSCATAEVEKYSRRKPLRGAADARGLPSMGHSMDAGTMMKLERTHARVSVEKCRVGQGRVGQGTVGRGGEGRGGEGGVVGRESGEKEVSIGGAGDRAKVHHR